MIPSKRGKHLLMIEGYTYSQMKDSRNYYCSKKDSGCRARVKLDEMGGIANAQTEHQHPPPKYLFTSQEFGYDIVTSQKGKDLILIDGFTFSQVVNCNNSWVCSTKNPKCFARLRLQDGKIVKLCNEHCHPPKKYLKCDDEITIQTAKSQKGKDLILLGGYTFTNNGHSSLWYFFKLKKGIVIDKVK
ncbi:unnamed protein product [Chilo suppressalis]|uniref:FLYWCH-type domain-containing protein n=1 Tax=Chilo suppressalis TaxID=168631 RepID=A0ABN8AYE4_CHISP|nr:unnamed protein product [Chilo suppressalis]